MNSPPQTFADAFAIASLRSSSGIGYCLLSFDDDNYLFTSDKEVFIVNPLPNGLSRFRLLAYYDPILDIINPISSSINFHFDAIEDTMVQVEN